MDLPIPMAARASLNVSKRRVRLLQICPKARNDISFLISRLRRMPRLKRTNIVASSDKNR